MCRGVGARGTANAQSHFIGWRPFVKGIAAIRLSVGTESAVETESAGKPTAWILIVPVLQVPLDFRPRFSQTWCLMRLVLNIESGTLTTLDQLKPGQRAEIVRIDGVDGIAARLREMGFVPGEPVQYLRCAPFGGPVKCSIHGSRIAVRGGEARRVMVRLVG